MYLKSRFCFVLFMVGLVGLTAAPRAVEASGGPIPAATTGVSCKTGHKWGTYNGTTQNRPADGATLELYLRCFFNPPNTSNGNTFMANLGSWDGTTSRPFVEICVGGTLTSCTSGTSQSAIVTDSLKMCHWGDLRRADGTLTRAGGSLSPACGAAGPYEMPDNYAEFYFTAPWLTGYAGATAGTNYYLSSGLGGRVLSLCFTDGACNSTTQLGGSVMPQVAASSASSNDTEFGLVSSGLAWWISGAPDAYPDTFENGGSFPASACEGIDFALRENGVTLAGSLSGIDGDESKTYVLRVLGIPTTGDAETFTFYFDGDAGGDGVGPTYLGTVQAPASSSTRDFNVTGIIAALEDPTPDLGAV